MKILKNNENMYKNQNQQLISLLKYQKINFYFIQILFPKEILNLSFNLNQSVLSIKIIKNKIQN